MTEDGYELMALLPAQPDDTVNQRIEMAITVSGQAALPPKSSTTAPSSLPQKG
jgi:hypothetical protein